MHWERDPTLHNLARKTRVFMGLLMNLEGPLAAANFDLGDAYAFSLDLHSRLDRLSEGEDPHDQFEVELLQRFGAAVETARHGSATHPQLPGYARYLSQWRNARHPELASTGVPPGRSPLQETDLFGAPPGRWYHLFAKLQAPPKPHEFVSAYTLFLAGLQCALNQPERSGLPEPALPAVLDGASRNDLERAVDFALQSEPQSMARAMARLPEDVAFHCLFMGIAYVVQNPDEASESWLETGPRPEQQLYLLVAAGVCAESAPSAARLITPIRQNLPRLASIHLGDRVGHLLNTFSA